MEDFLIMAFLVFAGITDDKVTRYMCLILSVALYVFEKIVVIN